MPRLTTREQPLTARAVKALPPGRHKIDGPLYLNVSENGCRSWCLRYTSPVTRKQREMGLGTYAFSSKDVGLTMSAATAQATELRVTLLMKGLDPLVERERKEAARAAACAVAPPLTFREAAIEFTKSKEEGWKAAYAELYKFEFDRTVGIIGGERGRGAEP